MNDFSELEAELRQLRPAPVSVELSARIESALTQAGTATAGLLPPSRQHRGLWWTLALGLTTATALILLGLGFVDKPSSPIPPPVTEKSASSPASLTEGLRPSVLSRVVYHQQDEGLVFSPNQSERLLRRVRYDTRETMQWRNPLTGASLRVSYPAEQVVLTPVSFQ